MKKRTTRRRDDFVQVQLTAAGKRLAGEHGIVRFANGRIHHEFRAGEAKEVYRGFDWNMVLQYECFEGEPILEMISAIEPDIEIAVEEPEVENEQPSEENHA